jgi:hypothetical protein
VSWYIAEKPGSLDWTGFNAFSLNTMTHQSIEHPPQPPVENRAILAKCQKSTIVCMGEAGCIWVKEQSEEIVLYPHLQQKEEQHEY